MILQIGFVFSCDVGGIGSAMILQIFVFSCDVCSLMGLERVSDMYGSLPAEPERCLPDGWRLVRDGAAARLVCSRHVVTEREVFVDGQPIR